MSHHIACHPPSLPTHNTPLPLSFASPPALFALLCCSLILDVTTSTVLPASFHQQQPPWPLHSMTPASPSSLPPSPAVLTWSPAYRPQPTAPQPTAPQPAATQPAAPQPAAHSKTMAIHGPDSLQACLMTSR